MLWLGPCRWNFVGLVFFLLPCTSFKKIYGPTETGAKHDEICFYTVGVNYNSRSQQMVENYCQGEKPPVIDLCHPHRARHNQLESHQNRFEKIAPLDLNQTESCCCSPCQGNIVSTFVITLYTRGTKPRLQLHTGNSMLSYWQPSRWSQPMLGCSG